MNAKKALSDIAGTLDPSDKQLPPFRHAFVQSVINLLNENAEMSKEQYKEVQKQIGWIASRPSPFEVMVFAMAINQFSSIHPS